MSCLVKGVNGSIFLGPTELLKWELFCFVRAGKKKNFRSRRDLIDCVIVPNKYLNPELESWNGCRDVQSSLARSTGKEHFLEWLSICAHRCLRRGARQSNPRYKISSEAKMLQCCEQVQSLHPVEGFLGIKGYDYFWVRMGGCGVDDAEKPSNVGEWVPLSNVPRLIFWHHQGHDSLHPTWKGLRKYFLHQQTVMMSDEKTQSLRDLCPNVR